MNKKLISIILSSALLLCTSASGVEAAPEQKSFPASQSRQRETMIVTLSAPSLLDRLNQSGGAYKNISELILSDEGKRYSETIIAAQEGVKDRISTVIESADFSESRSFTAITNGFTLTADTQDIERIETINGIASVTVSKTIKNDEAPSDEESSSADASDEERYGEEASQEEGFQEESETEEASEVSEQEESEISEVSEEDDDVTEEKAYDSFQLIQKEDVNVVPVYESGYTGKGMLIGILDSELDVTHKAFSFGPDEIAYDKDYVRAVHRSARLNIDPEYSIDDIYYNGKVIYSYDYGENDKKVINKSSQHGTHVSGIAAGDSRDSDEIKFKGMAYDAQLAFFKIADENNKLKDEYIISALDDVIKLCPDVINCSYGAVQYLMHDYEGRQLYEKLINSGIAVVAAAGNDAYNAQGAYREGIPVWYSTYGTISLPSAMDGSLSVAASVPEYFFENIMTMTANNEKDIKFEKIYADIDFDEVYPHELLSTSMPRWSDISKTKYIYYDGIGTSEEFETHDVKDKIVVLNESSLSPEKLIKNSANYNIYAMLVIRSEKDSKYAKNDLDSDFFVYAVDNSEKEYFSEHPEGTIRISIKDQLMPVREGHAGEIASFSSYGTKADLALKPDITAPGENILSSILFESFQTYSMLSGTSMATPCITGSYAIMKQYAKERELTKDLSPREAEEFIYKLMMSTSKIMEYPDSEGKSLYYSPRLQGSGMLDLGAATGTRAFLSVDDKRPKASLLESSTGSYSFEFTINSFSNEPMTFNLDHIIQTDSYMENPEKKSANKYLNTLIPEDISKNAKVYFKVNGNKTRNITLAPGASETVKVIIRIDSDFIEERSAVFTNGFYVDGFVRLTSVDNAELSLPFSGFCGKWAESKIFPDNMFSDDCEFPAIKSSLSISSSFDNENAFSETAGRNIFQYDDLPSVIAFGKDSLSSYRHIPSDVFSEPSILLPNIYILRDAMDYTISISDLKGTQLLCQNFGDIPSYINGDTSPADYFVSKNRLNQLEQYYSFVNNAREGEYLYTLEASTVGTNGNPERKESVSMSINIDNTRPRITDLYLEKTKEGKLYLNIEASDNLFLQGINFFAVQKDDNGEIAARQELYEEILEFYDRLENSTKKFVSYSYDSNSKKYTFRYDLSLFKSFLNGLIHQGSEIYIDDDVTIIFENEKDFSLIENNCIAIEPVDCAYLCGNEEIINLDAYGEASFKLIDPYGEPLADIEVLINGKRYFSDDDGVLKVKNLPMGRNRLTIMSPYVRKNLNSFYDFKISPQSYKYEKTIKLYKSSSTHSGTAHDQEPTKIVNFDTGDRAAGEKVFILISAILTSSLTLSSLKRKRGARK